jgi:hypothetical protein
MKFLQQVNRPLVHILLLAVGVAALLGVRVDSSVIVGVAVGIFEFEKWICDGGRCGDHAIPG